MDLLSTSEKACSLSHSLGNIITCMIGIIHAIMIAVLALLLSECVRVCVCVCVCVCASLHPPANMQCDARTRADTYRAQTQTHTCVMQLLFESSQPVGTDHELLVAELHLHKPRIERSSTERLNTSSRVVESPHSVSCTTHEQYLSSRTCLSSAHLLEIVLSVHLPKM